MHISPLTRIDGPNAPDHCLSLADLCRWSGVGRTKIYDEIKAGRLRNLPCGTRTLFHPDDVRAWLLELRRAAEQ